MSKYSSDDRVTDFGFALVALVLYRNVMGTQSINDIHLAAEHRKLSNIMHMLVVNTAQAPVSFYYIDASNVREQNLSRVNGQSTANGLYVPNILYQYQETNGPKKCLPYIPLILNGRYFLYKYSEMNEAELMSINCDGPISPGQHIDEHRIKSLTMRWCHNNDTVLVFRKSTNDVTFDLHRQYLLGNNGVGVLLNFPIYPVNLMSIHMCQGRTITGPVHMNLDKTTYQGLYVAISRVTDPQQITRVSLPKPIPHLISAIVNFEELCNYTDDTSILPVQLLEEKFKNYLLYDTTTNVKVCYHLAEPAVNFLHAKTKAEKEMYRSTIIDGLTHFKIAPIILTPLSHTMYSFELTSQNCMNVLMDYKFILLALSCLDGYDAAVWLNEFIRAEARLSILNFKTEKILDLQTPTT
ncbi:uncharacterized protein LOC120351004 [Nilaparvata lugens]|uniref:uncharacterized protein LOC120351004 n=1 Tax=Nilaparvata lugens TaxID=108931 RepID=UPI00193E872C|nr:uncharacterized protein LOC120351004 [Nilaparvata lugens]